MVQKFQIHATASQLLWAVMFFMLIPTTYTVFTNTTTLLEWNLLSIMSTPIMFTTLIDPFGLMFSCTVLLISANVLQFSSVYMKDDKFINRFTVLVLLFILSMNLLIFLPHLMMLLLGWDGLGFTSFVLVIYYQNPKSLAAGMITALTNRIGDVMLLLSIAWTINQGHWNIIHMWNSDMVNLQIVAIVVAAMTKSAQMPFSSWLPAAMAAPTPVSALVHSSTLVTAGVFLLIRFYPFLSTMKWFGTTLLLVAVSTTLMAGLSAITECDMKKIIALSTLSQLGMMMAALGLNMHYLAYFHMVTHAMFKALLFICAGSLIHSHMHSQDLRWMGNLMNQMPVASSCMLIANMALCGFPFMSGFYSKDLILEASLFFPHNMLMIMLILFAVGLTSYYSIRFSMWIIWSPNNSNPYISLTENTSLMTPMIIMASMSVIAGSAILWTAPLKQEIMVMSPSSKMAPMVILLVSAMLAWSLSAVKSTSTPCPLTTWITSHYASCSMWFLVPLSSQFTMEFPMYAAHNYLKMVDQSWLELSSGQGMNKSINLTSNSMVSSLKPSAVNYLMMSSITMVIMMSTFIF